LRPLPRPRRRRRCARTVVVEKKIFLAEPTVVRAAGWVVSPVAVRRARATPKLGCSLVVWLKDPGISDGGSRSRRALALCLRPRTRALSTPSLALRASGQNVPKSANHSVTVSPCGHHGHGSWFAARGAVRAMPYERAAALPTFASLKRFETGFSPLTWAYPCTY
jgi:hypothetical protein